MNKIIHHFLFIGIFLLVVACGKSPKPEQAMVKYIRPVWTKEQAQGWYKQWGWLRGSDFIPSSAINQLEMWQAETFDTVTIDRELGWAESIGLNSMRVYLHHAAWEAGRDGFLQRIEKYLAIADRHHISTLFTLFDDCWNPTYKLGKQPEPKTGIHNSGWVRDPGDLLFSDSTVWPVLERYVKDVLTHFGRDKRIVLWDLYNEPGNSGYNNKSIPLLNKVFEWGWEVNPSQPLSVGYWNEKLKDINSIILNNSDVITYHNYAEPQAHQALIDTLTTLGKPLICTEYMARTRGSLFNNIMPILMEQGIGAYNWGLVAGKTNTMYAWDKPMPEGKEPKIWFHDIFRKDGTAFDEKEVALIRTLTGKNK